MSLLRPLAFVLLAALTALSGGCATTQRLAAAGDVHALLVAIRDNDRAAFEAHVDRPALESQLRTRIVERTAGASVGDTWRGVALLLAEPLSRAAGALVVRPEVFRLVADYYGYRPETPLPSALALASVLRPLPGRRVCAEHGKPPACLLTFADEGGTWRLVSFDGDTALLKPKGR